jgi:hypothetical protein
MPATSASRHARPRDPKAGRSPNCSAPPDPSRCHNSVRWDLVVPALVALAAAVSCARAAARAGNGWVRMAWWWQCAACALWILAPVGWLAGVDLLAAVGWAGFLGLSAAGLALALNAARQGERGMPAWFLAGLFAIAVADLDVARGAGSAGLGWLLGFGCLGMAAHVHLRPIVRRKSRRMRLKAALASIDEQLELAEALSDLPTTSPFTEQPEDLLGVSGGELYETKRTTGRRRR